MNDMGGNWQGFVMYQKKKEKQKHPKEIKRI